MSTRALYTFKGDEGSFNVYKHHDGYPSGAAQTLKTAIDWFAWQLPRFEADEFAAAFCAAGKIGWVRTAKEIAEWAREHGPTSSTRAWVGGGVRLMPAGDPTAVALANCSDIEYRYEITVGTPLPKAIEGIARKKPVAPELLIRAFKGNWWDSKAEENEIFNGTFTRFHLWALKKDKVRVT
jgi:hypothetical protein